MAGQLPFYVPPSSSAYHQVGSCQKFLQLFSCRRRAAYKSCFTVRFRHLKCVVVLALALLAVICYIGGFSMLPDDHGSASRFSDGSTGSGSGSGLGKALKKFFGKPPDGPDYVLSRPGPYDERYENLTFDQGGRLRQDRMKFSKKTADDLAGQIPKPKSDRELQRLEGHKNGGKKGSKPDSEVDDAERKANTVRNMTIFAWDNYKKYAWSDNELRPISKTGHSASIFGRSKVGATIVDAMDTLYIMGLLDRFDESKNWVEMSFDFSQVHGDISVFETTIRFIGGFLTCFALTGDTLFKRKAEDVAKLLLPAFDTPTGIPYSLINVKNGKGTNFGWASGGSSILSEFGTLSLEFDYLSIITGNPVYSNKMRKIRETLNSLDKMDDLYPNYLNPKTGKWGMRHVSMGALGDSFYEYLLKSWLITNKRDVEGFQMYEKSMHGFQQNLFGRSQDNLFYIAEMKGTRTEPKMDHLACFSGGMFGLHAINSPNATTRDYWLEKAEDLAHTCHESYIRTPTKLGPESFRFINRVSAVTEIDREKYYILRPEVIETWFYLWRLTKKQKYRDWAWEAVQAIERHCKTPNGYSGIKNVYDARPEQDDVQQSFFLAETLKYLYLIFKPDDVVSLQHWVFNTEAHPLPIRFYDEDHAPGSMRQNPIVAKNLVLDDQNNNENNDSNNDIDNNVQNNRVDT